MRIVSARDPPKASPSTISAELIGSAQTAPELAAAFRRIYREPAARRGNAVLQAAQDRGVIGTDVNLDVLSDQLWGACMYRLLMGHQPVDEKFAASSSATCSPASVTERRVLVNRANGPVSVRPEPAAAVG